MTSARNPSTPPSGEGLQPLWAAALAAWPNVALPQATFFAYVTHCSDQGSVPDVARAADLYLACACAEGLPRALEAFDRALTTAVARGVMRIDPSPAFRDLVIQDLRTRLLLGDPPKIADYAGRASLASWLKTAAVRAALNLRRARGDQPHDSLPSALVAAAGPDVALVRAKYKVAFEDALRAALVALPERERSVLTLSLGKGLSIDALAAKFGIGRSTAARWLIAARELLTQETRRILIERLGLTPSELDSVAADVRSDVEVSVVRLLEEL